MQTHSNRGHSPTGMRGITDVSLLAKDLAERFEGLREGVAKGQVLSAFKRASVALDIHPRHVFAIDKLMGFSYEQDWEDQQRPIVWPSNERLQEELGLSRRMVQYTMRQLVDLQLITPVDSPTGKRYGRRDRMGYITEAYGFDLSPLATRHDEFKEVAAKAEDVRRERGKLRRQITIAKKTILQIAFAALEDGLAGGDWEDWAEEALELAGRVVSQMDLVALKHILEALWSRQEEAETALRNALIPVDNSENTASKSSNNSPEGAMDCTHNTTTTELKNNKLLNTVDNSKGLPRKSSSELVEGWNQKSRDLDSQIVVKDNMEQYKITPKLVDFASPNLSMGRYGDNPSWNDILDAAYSHKTMLGVSDSIWGEACQVLTRHGAAVVMAVVVAKRMELKSPGGYFRGMVKKARQGELNLGPTLYALRDIREGNAAVPKTRSRSILDDINDRSWADDIISPPANRDVATSIGDLAGKFRTR